MCTQIYSQRLVLVVNINYSSESFFFRGDRGNKRKKRENGK